VEQGHPAIRSSAAFEMVQMEIARCKQEDRRYSGLVERYEKAKARFDEVTEVITQRSAKSERLRREASPFRGRGSSGHLRRRRDLRVQKRRILRLPRTSTSVCVGGGVR